MILRRICRMNIRDFILILDVLLIAYILCIYYSNVYWFHYLIVPTCSKAVLNNCRFRPCSTCTWVAALHEITLSFNRLGAILFSFSQLLSWSIRSDWILSLLSAFPALRNFYHWTWSPATHDGSYGWCLASFCWRHTLPEWYQIVNKSGLGNGCRDQGRLSFH